MNPPDESARTGSPEWFDQALAAPSSHRVVRVHGAEVHYRLWGGGERTPVVLLHGSGANSSWWDHVAPHLASGSPVVAVDLSGHGESGRRERYDYAVWAEEVLSVLDHAGIARGAALVGHSFGGAVALFAHHRYSNSFESVTTVDSPLRVMSPGDWKVKTDRASKPLRVYARQRDAIRAFRTVPAQPIPEYVRRHVATRSVRQVENGWTWKFDPRVFNRPQFDPGVLRPTTTPITLLRSECGSMSLATSDAMVRRLGGRAQQLTILGANHHVMFDQPIALIASLQALLLRHDVSS